jgi:hypothetical protein
MPAQNRPRITAISIILTPPTYYGYVASRSWFRAGFVGAGKWFRPVPPWALVRPLSRPVVAGDHRGQAAERGGEIVQDQRDGVDRQGEAWSSRSSPDRSAGSPRSCKPNTDTPALDGPIGGSIESRKCQVVEATVP